MLASELYAKTLGSLTEARRAMLSPAWVEAQMEASAEMRLEASRTLIRVQQAIAALSNAVLEDIAGAMEAQAQPLQEAIANLNAALTDMSRVQAVLGAAATLLSIAQTLVVFL